MKLICWNVNGIRSILKKGALVELLNTEKPDILCLQEVRNNTAENVEGFKFTFYHHAEKKGYSGVGISCNIEPVRVWKGFEAVGDRPFKDNEGRILTLEFSSSYVISVYVPNSKPDLSRLDYRTREWDKALRDLITHYQKTKPVIVCGDFNVAHLEIDIYNTKGKSKEHGFTLQERASFSELLGSCNLVDSYRHLHPEDKKYTWFSNFAKSRERNVGWRIDYVLLSSKLKTKIKKADILSDVPGSDHIPIVLEMTGGI